MSFELLNKKIVNCRSCPRLVRFREWAAANPPRRFRGEAYWAKPLTGFGDVKARILVLGLAPAAHGGNRTGRMFTGDSSGNTLMKSLYRNGFANREESIRRDDGLVLRDVFLTAVVRCPPPDNKPLKSEIENCLSYFVEEFKMLENVRVCVVLGRIAFDSFLKFLKSNGVIIDRKPRFRHGGVYRFQGKIFGRGVPLLIASYHPSRQNTSTGRLTQNMLDNVFRLAREFSR